jgi:hypothetical protein
LSKDKNSLQEPTLLNFYPFKRRPFKNQPDWWVALRVLIFFAILFGLPIGLLLLDNASEAPLAQTIFLFIVALGICLVAFIAIFSGLRAIRKGRQKEED